MELQFIRHNEILFQDLLRVIDIKSFSWPYPFESQQNWIMNNVHDDDTHVFLRHQGQDLAYLLLTPVSVELNGDQKSFLGVGCVCSRFHGAGNGKELMRMVNLYLRESKQRGLLFCRDINVGFYKKCDWTLVPSLSILFSPPKDGIFAMTYNCEDINLLKISNCFF